MIKNMIKLIIWDMDDTFWKGTISEGDIEPIEHNINVVRTLTDRGIMNSISSKNEFAVVKNKLQELEIFDYFIFPVVNWDAKGPQIKQLISKCQLREENVLFIDDNSYNRQEALYYCPKLNVESPEIIENILNCEFLKGKNDKEHSRLKEYKLLEIKQKVKEEFHSNEEFLYASNIRVFICTDCLNEIERINELIHRTNQLNYTKKRIAKEELEKLIQDVSYNCAYIKVEDNYGEYGIVGFYAYKNSKLEHFLFSCRTLGMGVEQWIYAKLGYPDIVIEEPVSNKLEYNNCPKWINKNLEQENNKKRIKSKNKILIRGGCDLKQMEYYLQSSSKNITCEFNYLNYHREHTVFMRGILEYSNEIKEQLVSKVPFLYKDCFESKMFQKEHDIIVYSVLMDYVQKVYYLKEMPNIKIAYGSYNRDVTEEIRNKWNEEENDFFLNNLIAGDAISAQEFKKNLQFIRDNIGKETKLIIINGCEVPSVNIDEKDYHLRHKELNKIVDEFIEENNNTYLLDVRKYVKSSSDLANNIRHYQRQIYYHMAQELIGLIGTQKEIKIKSKVRRGVEGIVKSIRKNLSSWIKRK